MNIKNTLWSLATLVLGGVVGYYIAEKRLRDQYKEDLLDVQEFYYDKLRELGVMEEDFEPPTDEEVLESFRQVTGYYDQEEYSPAGKNKKKSKKKSESNDSKPEKLKGRPIFNYSKPPLEKILSELENEPEEPEEDDEDDEEDEEFELEMAADELAQERREDEPYLIDNDEYEHSPEGYDKQVLYYYSHDKILCEDDDSIVDDPENLIGYDYEDELTLQTVAWVRNDYLLTLYEIHRVDTSYQDTIANLRETPREREFRLVARRKAALDD